MKLVVEFYCYQENVSYCQGMLEVILPFLFMKHAQHFKKDKQLKPFDLACVYAYFKQFVRTFIPNNLHTKNDGMNNITPHIRCSITLIDVVLGYCDR